MFWRITRITEEGSPTAAEGRLRCGVTRTVAALVPGFDGTWLVPAGLTDEGWQDRVAAELESPQAKHIR
jgi:hypothetical protein